MMYAFPVLAFLIASVPFGLIIGKAHGIDIRKHGSGNIGATNVLRVLGGGPGGLCFLLDVAKGALPVLLATNLIRFNGGVPAIPLPFLEAHADYHPADKQHLLQALYVVTAVFGVLGHNYSPWLGWKGGKGIATSLGVIIPLMPFAALVVLSVWGVVLLVSKYVSVASIAGAVVLPVTVICGQISHGKYSDGTWNRSLLILALMASGMAIWRHRANITRLRQGTEPKIGKRRAPDAA